MEKSISTIADTATTQLNACSGNGFYCFLIDPTNLAFLNWFGFLIGLLGLATAGWQIYKLRTAAEHAKASIDALSYHIDGVNLAYINAQMSSVMHLIHTGDYALAEIAFAPIKRSLRLQAKAIHVEVAEEDQMKRLIGRITTQLRWGVEGNNSFSAIKARRCVDELVTLVTDWEGNVAQKNREVAVNENA